MKSKQTILVLLVLGLVAAGAVFGVTLVAVAAEDLDGYPPIIQALAERFNLDPDEVKQVFDENREAKHEQMQQRHEDRLDEAVEAGQLTEEQKDELLERQEEMNVKMAELKDLPPQERFEAMKEIKEDLQAWLEENDIDLKGAYGGFGKGHFDKRGFGKGHFKGRGMGHGPGGGFWKGAPPADGATEQDTSFAL